MDLPGEASGPFERSGGLLSRPDTIKRAHSHAGAHDIASPDLVLHWTSIPWPCRSHSFGTPTSVDSIPATVTSYRLAHPRPSGSVPMASVRRIAARPRR